MINGAERQNVKRRTGLKFCNKELRLLYPLNQVLLLWMCLLCRKLKHVGKMNPDECKQKLLELNNLLQVPHQHTRLHKMSCVFSSRSNCLEPQRTRCVCAGPMHKHKSTQRLNTQSTWLSQVGPSLLEWCNWICTSCSFTQHINTCATNTHNLISLCSSRGNSDSGVGCDYWSVFQFSRLLWLFLWELLCVIVDLFSVVALFQMFLLKRLFLLWHCCDAFCNCCCVFCSDCDCLVRCSLRGGSSLGSRGLWTVQQTSLKGLCDKLKIINSCAPLLIVVCAGRQNTLYNPALGSKCCL